MRFLPEDFAATFRAQFGDDRERLLSGNDDETAEMRRAGRVNVGGAGAKLIAVDSRKVLEKVFRVVLP